VVGYQRFRGPSCLHLQCSVVVGYHHFRGSCCLHLQCSVMVGYHHFRGPCCLHLQCSVVVGYQRFRSPENLATFHTTTNSVSIVTRLRAGRSRVNTRQGQ
jgi:hypothetical protein